MNQQELNSIFSNIEVIRSFHQMLAMEFAQQLKVASDKQKIGTIIVKYVSEYLFIFIFIIYFCFYFIFVYLYIKCYLCLFLLWSNPFRVIFWSYTNHIVRHRESLQYWIWKKPNLWRYLTNNIDVELILMDFRSFWTWRIKVNHCLIYS